MNLSSLIQYLSQKEPKTRLEILALHALNDNEFKKEYNDFNFANKISGFQNIINNPAYYDQNDNALYQYILINIFSIYSAYLYDKKGKYSNLRQKIGELEEKIKKVNNDIDNIKRVSDLISGEKVLEIYAKEFKERSENYEEEAKRWQKKLYWSFFIFGIVVVLFFFFSLINVDVLEKHISKEFIQYGYFAVVAIKVIVLIGLIQVIRFFYRNYNANKHLASQSLHKCDVLRALRGIYNVINLDNKDARDELIKTGALTAFQNIESGYITTKEGAGSADVGLYSIINNILKR